MIKKLDVMVILVKDTLKTAEFYKKLGFTLRKKQKIELLLKLVIFI